jgi:hypothetical protein
MPTERIDHGDEKDRVVLDSGPGTDVETQAARQTGASPPERHERPGAAYPGQLSEVVRGRLDVGMEVFGAEGDRLGSVAEVTPDWFRVDTEAGTGGVMYLPRIYIEDIVRDRVILNQLSGLLYDMDLSSPPLAAYQALRSEHEQRR